jgi:hypothetical protein
MDEVFGEEYAPGLRYGDWRCSELLKKESPQLSLADAETFRKYIHGVAFAIESAVGDEGKCARDSVGGSAPGGEFGCSLGAATQTRAKSGFMGCCSGWIKGAVFVLRGPGRTHGAAVDSGGFDANIHQTIEARVAALEGPIAGLFIR